MAYQQGLSNELLTKLKKSLTEKQLSVIKQDLINRPIISVSHGAVRSGKTREKMLLFCNHVHEFSGSGKKFIMTGATIGTIKRNILDDIAETFNVNIRLNKDNEFELFGNTVCCFGTKDADDYKTIKGFTAYGWYGNEVTESHKMAIDQCFKRCSGKGMRIFWETNPAAPNHFIKKLYIDKSGLRLSNNKLWLSAYHYVIDDNTFLDPGVVESIKQATPAGIWYDRDILGLWVASEGMIYKDFDIEKAKCKELPDNIVQYIGGIDWGWEHKGVILVIAIDSLGNFYICREIVEQHEDIDWWIDRMKALQMQYRNIIWFADTARPDLIDKAKKKGIRIRDDLTKKDVMAGIACCAALFKENKIRYIENETPYFLDEIYLYHINEKTNGEAPVKVDDDVMDAMRYAIYSYVSAAKFGRRQRAYSENICF